MYVKSIVLEGFKSYRDLTRIGPFDPHFNAITGLNGSGKSNVLDGICFVLGISSMSVVRCKNLADCIYTGHGETLTKASVSIVLDNKDKSKSPPGNEQYDEIIVSRVVHRNGDCRYYVNKTSSSKRGITDLFESVQLNVNNPNFMIMQGKITKVVNMKPKEILHMIEEAVGATLYQSKREKAEVELRNKSQTITSIEQLISDHIQPTLDKQKRAMEQIQEYNILMREKNEKQIQYAIAHFFQLKIQGRKASEQLSQVLEQDEKDDELAEQYKTQIKQLKHREEQMKKENTSRFKERMDKAESVLKTEKKKLQEKETDVKTAKEALTAAKKAEKDAVAAKKNEEKHVTDFKKKSANALAEFEQLQQEKTNALNELEKAREQETQLRSGKILDDEGKSMDVDQELNRLATEITALKPDVEDGRQRISENKGKLGQLDHQLKQTPSDDQVERDYTEKRETFEILKREATKRNINADESVLDIRNKLDASVKRRDVLLRQKNSITSQNFQLSFNYDKNRVNSAGIRGCLYEHIKVNEVDKWGNAMESALSGLMGHIVVDTDKVGTELVKNGQMQRRTMVHPLNKFESSYRRPNFTQQQLDQKFGEGNAVFALSLLEYDQDVAPIVEHYMGGKVLCADMDMARKLAFEMRIKAYTAAGDCCDPGGLMHGGTRSGIGRTIRDCVNLFAFNQELRQLNQDISTLTRQLELGKGNEKFIEQLERAKRELHNADQMRKLTKFSQLKEEIETLKSKLQEDGSQLQELETRYKSLEKERTLLQKKADQVENLREKNIRDNANMIKKWEKALEAATKKYETRQKYFNDIEMDLRSKEDYLNGCQKDIDDAVAHVAECEGRLESAQEEVRAFMEQFEEFQQAYDAAVAESNEWHEESKQIQDQIKALDKEKEASVLNKMKRDNERKKFQGHVDYCREEIESLQERFQDIDFANTHRPKGSVEVLKRELDAVSKTVESRQTTLDHEAAAGYANTKLEYESTTDKLLMINRNKQNLIKAIATLDKSKKDKVKAAYEDVNAKFNDMMTTLLPEARARLVEVVPGDLSQGVNIHVQLGGVWKESLTELSGGQRSLVALSLVLSLCMYNPAPFYILDEVDAALDLSHTQNIGLVIQRQFKGTQFICVSLKDGMFSNANVLFTDKHEGGRSVVTRSAKLSSSRAMPPPNNEDVPKRKKK